MLTKNAILRLGSCQVKIAHDVQTAKGAVVFSEQVIDKTFGSCSVYVLHDVRSGEVGERPTRPQGLPRSHGKHGFGKSHLAYLHSAPICCGNEIVILKTKARGKSG